MKLNLFCTYSRPSPNSFQAPCRRNFLRAEFHWHFHLFLYSLKKNTSQVFIKCLLCVRHCARSWDVIRPDPEVRKKVQYSRVTKISWLCLKSVTGEEHWRQEKAEKGKRARPSRLILSNRGWNSGTQPLGAGQDNTEEVEAGTPGSCKGPLLWPNLNEAGSRPLAPLSVPAESNLSKNPVKWF